jgi:hypothetical protein
MDFKTTMMPLSFGRTSQPGKDVPTPTTSRSANRRAAALREAADILTLIPAPGESLHALMTGRYDLTDLLEVLLDRLGALDHLRIATLSFNRRNTKLLADWTGAGRVRKLTLLCSLFFVEHNPETVEELRQTLPDALFAASRNHCKVCCLSFADGRKLALEGSANLRTNSNREQFALIHDAGLHDWHGAWIDAEVAKHKGGQ